MSVKSTKVVNACKNQVPIVKESFIDECIKAKKLIEHSPYLLVTDGISFLRLSYETVKTILGTSSKRNNATFESVEETKVFHFLLFRLTRSSQDASARKFEYLFHLPSRI